MVAGIRREGSPFFKTFSKEMVDNIKAALNSYSIPYANTLTQRISEERLSQDATAQLANEANHVSLDQGGTSQNEQVSHEDVSYISNGPGSHSDKSKANIWKRQPHPTTTAAQGPT